MQTPALSPYSEEMMTKVLHQVPSCIKNMSVYRMKTSKIDALFEACRLEKEQLPKAHSTQLWSFRSRRPKASCQRNLRRCRLGALAKRLLKCACAKTWILFRSITMDSKLPVLGIFLETNLFRRDHSRLKLTSGSRSYTFSAHPASTQWL